MSTTSTATALVAQDQITNDKVDLLNHMCILILARCNGTPFDATSTLEDDIIEICIQLGCTHLKGVLWYSAIKSLVLFHSADELQVMAHGVIKAMMLHEEAIRIRTSLPSATHERAYMAVVNGEPSGTQPATPDKEEESQLSPSDPHPCRRTRHQLQVNLGDLGDNELWQLMEDLSQEVTLRELNAPPGSTTDPFGKSSGEWGSQYGRPGGHLSKRGRMGIHRTTTSTPCFHSTRCRVGTQRITALTPCPCSNQWRCGTSCKHIGHGIVTWCPLYKNFQQQSHAMQDRSVFQTMVPWGTVCKRPLSRVSGQREYCMIAKGGSSGYGHINGPYYQHSPYLPKLTVIFGTVVLFDVLMQNFYKITQRNHEKFPSFAMRLEGTLNQIRLQCPGRIMGWKVQVQLKDHLFHRVCKHIRDSIWYLYSYPRTNYSQLMITAHKAQSENEEAHDKVRAKSAVTTKPVEGTTELGNQIARLLAALTRAEQGNSPGSAPNSPDTKAMGEGGQTGTLLVLPTPIMAKLVLDKMLQPTAYLPITEQGPQVKAREMPKGLNIAREALQIRRTTVPSSASGAKVGATWLRNVPPQQWL